MSIDRVQGNRTSSRAGLDTLFASGSLTGLTDAQLVDAFLDRSEPQLAFAMIVERHGGMVLRVCRAILRNEADAEDALQVTFLVLASKAPSLRNRTSLAAWLHAVATRTARSARRGLARRRNLEANAVVKSQPHDRQSDNDLREQLQREVAKLPERLREVVVLREFEGLTEEQTAGQLGCAVGTVKSRLFRARKRLRARLENRGWDATGVFAPLAAPTLSLPANLVGSITDLSVSSGSSIPARLLVWRSMVLKGMLMKNVLSLATIALVVSIPVGSGWLIARAGKPDETKTQVSPTPKAAQAAEEERVATLYATLAKSQVALAEALVNEQRQLEDEERRGKRRILPVYRHQNEPEDRLLSARFDLATTATERIQILRRRLSIARGFEESNYAQMEREPGASTRLEARIATLHRLAIATQLAKEEMTKPADQELMMKAPVKDVDALRPMLLEFEVKELAKITIGMMDMRIQLPKQKMWTLNEFLIAWRAETIRIDANGIPIEVEGAALTDAKLELTSPIVCPDGPLSFADYLKKVLDPLGLKYSIQNDRLVYIDGKGQKKERKDGVPPHNYGIFPFLE